MAVLADLGYEISGFQASGSTPPLTSEGDDLIFGTNRAEIIYGLGGNDELQGNDGSDWLYGGEGSDTLFGETGSDVLVGEAGRDLLVGAMGNDLLLGEAGNDELQGNAGDDWLYGGEGEDRLFGQEGSDLFRFDAESGNDTIGDFVVAEDRIEVAIDLGFSSGAELLAAIATSASPVIGELFSSVLTLSPGNSIAIFHQQPLTEANFTVR